MQTEHAKSAAENNQTQPTGSRKNFDFLRGFLRNPGQVGSVIPSSRFMERKIIAMAELAKAKLVVELGPGTGGTTRALLRAMPVDAHLLTIDVDPSFTQIVQTMDDPRLIPHTGSALNLEQILDQYGLGAADSIVSGIPFSTMPKPVGQAIIQSIKTNLAPNGVFLAYQFREEVVRIAQPLLGQPEKSAFELFNVPPMRLYLWRKQA